MYIVFQRILSCIPVILIVTSGILADEGPAETSHRSTGICVLPPHPENGHYASTVAGGTPGDMANGFILNVTCFPGFNLIGDRTFSCLTGYASGPMPECLPYCDTDKQNQVVTCDAKALRCVLDNSAVVARGTTAKDDYECGELGLGYVKIIAGGHRAEFQELPWHAGIYRKTTLPYMQICGGSLISSNVVLSAAHCFWNDVEKLQSASRFAVAVGKLYRPWNNERDLHAQKSDVRDIKIPTRFQGSAANFQDDIAIVIVATSFTYTEYVNPVCLSFDRQLDEKHLKDGNFGKVGGWGLTGEDERASQVLKAVDLPYVDIQKCIHDSPQGFTPYITSDKICAGYSNGKTSL